MTPIKLRIYAGIENGHRLSKDISFGSRDEAEAAQRELASHTLAHAAGVGIFGNPRERLGPYLRDWLDRHTRLAPKTRAWYDVIARQVQQDALGTVPLGKLAPRAFEGYYARVLKAGKSSTTALHHHRLLHKALRDAERQDLILRNPVAQAEAPRRARVRLNVWTEAETMLLLSAAEAASPYHPLYLFEATTGVRLGEALGLTWRDVSLRDGTVTITQALQRPKGGGFIIKEPKTRDSERVIDLPPEMIAALRKLHERQAGEARRRTLCPGGVACRSRHRKGVWHAVDLVFCQDNGKPLHENNVRLRDLYPLCKRLGLPWRRALHNMRHGHGSHLLERNIPLRTVSERLGHRDPAFTARVYAHVLRGQAQAAAAVSAMLQTPPSDADHQLTIKSAEPVTRQPVPHKG